MERELFLMSAPKTSSENSNSLTTPDTSLEPTISSSEVIVVLGKTSIHKIEYEPLFRIGRAIAIRGKTLRTTKTPGACRAVVEGYESEGKSPEYITKAGDPGEGAKGVMAFTDAKYLQKLDTGMPGWKDLNWIIFHNRKATTEAARMIEEILRDLETPLD